MRTRRDFFCPAQTHGIGGHAMTQPFAKPALSIADQINKLIANGMTVGDRALAEHCLRHISYYRLSAYWLPFERPKGQAGPRFVPGTTFEQIVALYDFDRALRLLLLDAIERVEVAVRGNWAYQMAMLPGGSHSYVDAAHYADKNTFYSNYSRLVAEVGRSKDVFIVHYKKNYTGPVMPPVWMASEMLSFGQLSQWYAALKEPKLRQAVADPFALDETVFVPLVQQLATVRNSCAHHGRLWNKKFNVTLKLPKKQPVDLANALNRGAPDKIYNTLAMLQYLLDVTEPGHSWGTRLIGHIATLPSRSISEMGFPADWLSWKLWGGTK